MTVAFVSVIHTPSSNDAISAIETSTVCEGSVYSNFSFRGEAVKVVALLICLYNSSVVRPLLTAQLEAFTGVLCGMNCANLSRVFGSNPTSLRDLVPSLTFAL